MFLFLNRNKIVGSFGKGASIHLSGLNFCRTKICLCPPCCKTSPTCLNHYPLFIIWFTKKNRKMRIKEETLNRENTVKSTLDCRRRHLEFYDVVMETLRQTKIAKRRIAVQSAEEYKGTPNYRDCFAKFCIKQTKQSL